MGGGYEQTYIGSMNCVIVVTYCVFTPFEINVKIVWPSLTANAIRVLLCVSL